MTKRKRQHPDRDVPTYSPVTGDFDTDPAEDDEMWSEEELERASMGWRAEDDQQTEPVDTTPSVKSKIDEDELDTADDALTDRSAREMRRDQLHSSRDDYSAGFESVINANGPKEDNLNSKKSGGSRGKNDRR